MTEGYAAATASAALADRPDRAFLRMYGRDPLKMIQGLVSNDVAGAPEGRAVYATLLTPKGRMVTDMRVFRRADDLLLDVPAGALDGTTATLKKYVPPLFARFEVLEDMAMVGLYGPAAHDTVTDLFDDVPPADAPNHAWTATTYEDAPTIIVRSGYLAPLPGYEVISSSAALRALRASPSIRSLRPRELDALRIEAGTPQWGSELDETTIPLEANLREAAISETKGCYTGQEVIIRILHRGHVNRHLRGLRLGAVEPPAPGTPLFRADDGKNVGALTSATASPRLGETIALGYVRREIEPPGTVRLGATDGPDVTVVALPFGD